MRVFYVRVSRSQGKSDSEIAIRLGQQSGVALIESTYGTAEPSWIGNKKLDWMPETKPAWSKLNEGHEKIVVAMGGRMGGLSDLPIYPDIHQAKITLYLRP